MPKLRKTNKKHSFKAISSLLSSRGKPVISSPWSAGSSSWDQECTKRRADPKICSATPLKWLKVVLDSLHHMMHRGVNKPVTLRPARQNHDAPSKMLRVETFRQLSLRNNLHSLITFLSRGFHVGTTALRRQPLGPPWPVSAKVFIEFHFTGGWTA